PLGIALSGAGSHAPAAVAVIPGAGLGCSARLCRVVARWVLASGRPVAVDDLTFRAICGGGAVGAQDEPPAPSMNTHIMMKLTQKDTISDGCNASMALMAQVMHVAGGGSLATARPFAVAGAVGDSAANGAGDLV